MPLPRLSLPRPALPKVTLPGPSLLRRWRERRPASGQRPVERRRARALLLAAVLFCGIVLLSALPWSTLLNERSQLSSASAEVLALRAENRALADQARQLSNTSIQTALARQDYGLVHPGQTAYDILPPPGTTSSNAVASGHVPLDEAPVVPGSRRSQELLEAGVGGATVPGDAGATATDQTKGSTSRAGSRSGGGGFWSRVGHTLEFWS
jgi:cell division protein FtsB